MKNVPIYFEIGGLVRPHNGKKERLLLMLNKLIIVRSFPFIKRLFCNGFNLPYTTSYSKDFFTSAPNIFIENNVGLNDTFILAYAPVTIGEGSSFSFRNMIITSTHDLENFSTVIAKPVTIGKNVWITTNVTILPGVSIGDNTVIGAGSVVVNDIPNGVFATGNPCKVIKKIDFRKI
jgi:maltose O-acetyltransferase